MADGIAPVTPFAVPDIPTDHLPVKSRPIPATYAAPSSSESFTPSKPQIPTMGKALSRFIDATTDSQAQLAESNLEAVRRMTKRMGELELDRIHKLGEKAEKTYEIDTWDFFKQIAYCISSAVSIIVGGALCATGKTTYGGALIASGIGTLSAEFMRKNGVSEEVAGAIALASAGLGLVGSVGGIMHTHGEMTKLLLNIVTAITTLTSGVTQYQINNGQAELQEVEALHSQISDALQRAGVESDTAMADAREALKRLNVTHTVQSAARDYNEAMARVVTATAG